MYRTALLASLVALLGVSLADRADAQTTQPANADERRVWLRVTGDRVNVRTRPDANSRIVARMMQDDVLIGVGESFGWRKIVPPPGTYCLVSADYIDRLPDGRGVVEVDTSLRVRFGSDVQQRDPLQSEVCDRLQPDEIVQVLGDYNEEWLKIAPTERVRFYISGDFVEEISERDAQRLLAQAPRTGSAAATQPASRWARRLADLEAQIAEQEQKPAAERDWEQLRSDMRVIALQRTDDETAKLADAWVTKLTERIANQEALRKAQQIASGAERRPAGPPTDAPPATQPAPRRPRGPLKFDARGIIRPSFAFPTGPYGLRFKLQDPFSREVVAYVELSPNLRERVQDNLGRYVGIVGERREVEGVQVPFFIASELTVLNPTADSRENRDDD